MGHCTIIYFSLREFFFWIYTIQFFYDYWFWGQGCWREIIVSWFSFFSCRSLISIPATQVREAASLVIDRMFSKKDCLTEAITIGHAAVQTTFLYVVLLTTISGLFTSGGSLCLSGDDLGCALLLEAFSHRYQRWKSSRNAILMSLHDTLCLLMRK